MADSRLVVLAAVSGVAVILLAAVALGGEQGGGPVREDVESVQPAADRVEVGPCEDWVANPQAYGFARAIVSGPDAAMFSVGQATVALAPGEFRVQEDEQALEILKPVEDAWNVALLLEREGGDSWLFLDGDCGVDFVWGQDAGADGAELRLTPEALLVGHFDYRCKKSVVQADEEYVSGTPTLRILAGEQASISYGDVATSSACPAAAIEYAYVGTWSA